MQRAGLTNRPGAGLSLGDLLTARPTGLTEVEAWAILCQAVQALQDLFLSDGASGGLCVPLVTPSTILLSSRGRVKLHQSSQLLGCGIPAHLTGYLAPEYRPNKQYSDTETEKMWIYGLGETLKRATLTSHAATSRLSGELCRVLTDMTRSQALARANLMHLLDVISEYCKRRQQNRPFSHVVMDLHQETMAELELSLETPWSLPPIPGEIKTQPLNRYDSSKKDLFAPTALSNHWMFFNKNKPKLTREASTSMEGLATDNNELLTPGSVLRPKSMCIPTGSNFFQETNNEKVASTLSRLTYLEQPLPKRKNSKIRRNPVQRAASRLYRANNAPTILPSSTIRDCVGPEFVVRASFPSKQLTMQDCKGHTRKTVTVIMLNGQKLDVICNPNTTTAGQLFELIIQKEHIEENFMLGLSALIAGDFVFLPTDARICKAMTQGNNVQGVIALTLFVRVRFFLPSLRGIRSVQARHLLYLQLRRAILEYQLPCNYSQLVEFGGLALQAEFGDFNEMEHGIQDYFILDHYVPETLTCNTGENNQLKQDLIRSHISRSGLDIERAEEDFITSAQSLPHYGGHFYTATWTLKDNTQKEVWLYISAQGINLYERTLTSHQQYPVLLEMFEWRTIQTLCYSKHYLCILPHSSKMHQLKLKKYKLKMNHKKSYFTFRLASLHHQFFLRLRTQYTSLHTLSEQFGIQLKDMKNETNSLYKLEALTNPLHMALDPATVNAETEFKIEFCTSKRWTVLHNQQLQDSKCRRSKSISDFAIINSDCIKEIFQNKENEHPYNSGGLILDSRCLSGLPNSVVWDKRRGVKMGVRAFTNNGRRISRSMEAVNTLITEDIEGASLHSTSLNCSSTTISKSPVTDDNKAENAYILDSTIKSCTGPFLPDFQETLSQSFLDKLNKFSFADERILQTVFINRDSKGSLGLQIMEGSDGKVYIQSVISGGPAFMHGGINVGDQIVAVNGQNLLSTKYTDALDLLKSSGKRVEFVLSQISTSRASIHSLATLPSNDKLLCELNESNLNKLKRMSYPNYINYSTNIEKHVTESCHDITNVQKLNSIPYHKHIRYDLESQAAPKLNLAKNISQSCTALPTSNNRAVIVDMIPKLSIPHIPMPRSLGLSRKWRGPVRYPVTPIKKFAEANDDSSNYVTTSDEEQIFI